MSSSTCLCNCNTNKGYQTQSKISTNRKLAVTKCALCVVVCCGVLWCVVVCCGVLWCVVVCCGVLWCVVWWSYIVLLVWSLTYLNYYFSHIYRFILSKCFNHMILKSWCGPVCVFKSKYIRNEIATIFLPQSKECAKHLLTKFGVVFWLSWSLVQLVQGCLHFKWNLKGANVWFFICGFQEGQGMSTISTETHGSLHCMFNEDYNFENAFN